jgi:hypothetical protein
MYEPPITTRKNASHAIQPVINATIQPEVRPLTTDPMKADKMELKARACGVRLHDSDIFEDIHEFLHWRISEEDG